MATLCGSGETGRIIKRSAGAFFVPREYENYDLEGKADLVVYTALLESGEVRHYTSKALVDRG